MAKINPVKVKQDADREEKAGRLDKAIALYRQLVDDNPRDWNTIKKIGDLYARMNKSREATQEYAKVADFYAKDGFLLKSIAIWKQITKLDPAAHEPYLNLADLYAKQGLMMEAKSQYQIVVDEYIKRGKTRDAGDVLRKMAEIDPGDLKIRSKLADLYTRDGNSAKAVEEHIAIAEELNKKGHLAEALQVLEKGLKIDPKSNRLRLELARVHLVQKNYDRASHFLEEAVRQTPGDTQILSRLGDAYLGSKKIEEAEATFKRLLELDPNEPEHRLQMGRLYLLQGQFDQAYEEFAPVVERLIERREGDKAAALLQQVVQKSSSHVKSLLKLADVYRQLNKDSSVASTYSQLTEAYINQGDWAQAASVLATLVSMEPQHEQHRTKLEFVRGKLSGAGRPPAGPPALSGPEIVDEEFELPEPEPTPSRFESAAAGTPPPARPQPVRAASGSAAARPSIELLPPLSEEDKEFVEEHLAEGKVFRKYGLVDKAADQFESVVARFPDNVEARQELREVYREKGQPAKAAEQSLALAEISRLKGDSAAAQQHEEEARRLMPEAVRAPAPAPAPPSPPLPRAAPPAIASASAPVPAIGSAAPAAQSAEAEDLVEEEIDLDAEEEIDLEVEESGLDTAGEEPEVLPAVALPGLDLEDELSEDEELPSRFIEEEVVEVDTFSPDVEDQRPHAEPPSLPGEAALVEDDNPLGLETGPSLAPEAESSFSAEADLQFPAESEAAFALEPELPAPSPPPPPREKPPAPPTPPRGKAAPPPAPLGEKSARAPAPRVGVAPAEAPSAGVPASAVAGTGVPADLQKILDEVDSYVALGFVDDAKDALLEIETRYPGDPSLVRKMQELGLEPEAGVPSPSIPPAAEPVPVGSPERLAAEDPFRGLSLDEAEAEAEAEPVSEPPGPAGTFGTEALLEAEASAEPAPEPVPALDEGPGMDLGAELGELFGAQSAVEETPLETGSTDLGDSSLADIFKEFKKGVDKQLGKEDYDTRYNLGIAYKEMGLVDEAIAEFQLAAKDESRLLECSSMLGICFLEKGLPKLAVKWFEKGLKAPGRREEEYQGLRYDLAMALEAAGEVDKALNLFTDLYGQDANFRDVAVKVRELRAALS